MQMHHYPHKSRYSQAILLFQGLFLTGHKLGFNKKSEETSKQLIFYGLKDREM